MEEKITPTWQVILRSGLLGGAVATYLCLIGIVSAFSERYLIGDQLTLGTVMLVFGMVVAGLLAARELKDRNLFTSLGSSFISGLITSLPLILLIVITIVFVIRPTLAGADYTLRNMLSVVGGAQAAGLIAASNW